MANKMLIDATHPEETRVVVVRGNRVEEFDYESANRKQLRGNIYLAKVTRVEPSLQAAFVDYGGNRHGFLAFSEIHPDYYQIPVADRQALIAEEERAHRDAEAEADRRAGGGGRRRERHQQRAAERASETIQSEPTEGDLNEAAESDLNEGTEGETHAEFGDTAEHAPAEGEAPAAPEGEHAGEPVPAEITEIHTPPMAEATASAEPVGSEEIPEHEHPEAAADAPVDAGGEEHDHEETRETPHDNGHEGEEEDIVESVGGADVMEEVPDRMPRLRRQYKIQEVIKRRQIMLVQVEIGRAHV